MASRLTVLVVFIIPVVASVTLAGAVMAQIIQNPGAGGGAASEYVTIVGLEPSYAAPATVETFVHVSHESFDCGDLYVEIRESQTGAVISQDGFFAQCFASTNTMIPLAGAFSASVAEPGTYEIIATINDAQKRNTAQAVGVFTVS